MDLFTTFICIDMCCAEYCPKHSSPLEIGSLKFNIYTEEYCLKYEVVMNTNEQEIWINPPEGLIYKHIKTYYRNTFKEAIKKNVKLLYFFVFLLFLIFIIFIIISILENRR